MVMPLKTKKNSRNKDKAKLERCSSAKKWIVSEITTQNPMKYNGPPLINYRKQDVSTTSTATQNISDCKTNSLCQNLIRYSKQPSNCC